MSPKITSLILCGLLATLSLCAQPNSAHTINTFLPRFLREGDRPQIGFLLQNNSKLDWSGSLALSLLDETNQPIDGWFFNSLANQYFTVEPDSTLPVYFPLEVPFQFKHQAHWKLQALSNTDTVSLQGTLSLRSWNYEEYLTPSANESISVNKKCWKIEMGKALEKPRLLDEYSTLHLGDRVSIQLILHVKKYISILHIQEGWAAGLSPIGNTSIRHAGNSLQKSTDKIQFNCKDNENTNEKEMMVQHLSPGIYTIEYVAIAKQPGSYNHPPAVIVLAGQRKETVRTGVSKINIE